MSVWVVVGGQYGSEGKGKVAALITTQESIDVCIRCGGPNSGHSFQREDGSMLLLRQLPTGVVRPMTRLLIPAGGLIDLEVLKAELDAFSLDESRVGIDRNAMVISEVDKDLERRSKLQERLSSTLCGVGAAVSRRALRDPSVELASQVALRTPWLSRLIVDVAAEANTAVDDGKKVLVEGTQGTGLSLYQSRYYPKVTSRDTSASGFLSEVGLSPRTVKEIVLVFRTYPIRVSGAQAGPLKNEISWEELTRLAAAPAPIREFTTVSKKLRRLGTFDWDDAKRAISLNRPTRIALNFCDYLGHTNQNASSFLELNDVARSFVSALSDLGSPVTYVGTGPRLRDTISVPTDSLPLIKPRGTLSAGCYSA